MTSINISQIYTHFLPKIAKEYNITDESSNRKNTINYTYLNPPSPFVNTTGVLCSTLSNNQINIKTSEKKEAISKKNKEKEEKTPNYLQLGVFTAIAAITGLFSLGRINSSIVTAIENIAYSNDVIRDYQVWIAGTQSGDLIYNIAHAYQAAEKHRETKLSHYQKSIMGSMLGTGIGVMGALASIELLSTIGIVVVVASVVFGAYQAGIHWDDFTKAQNEFINLNLLELSKTDYQNPNPNYNNRAKYQNPPFNPDYLQQS